MEENFNVSEAGRVVGKAAKWVANQVMTGVNKIIDFFKGD